MIMIGSIREFKKGMCDATYAIVRSMKNRSDWMLQMAELSPSRELFHDYIGVWKPAGEWNRATFEERYAPRFLRQLANDPAARERLNEIWRRDRAEETVGLACFCGDETLCHRSIVAGLLQGAGADVRLASGADYSRYFEEFRAMEKRP